VNSDRGALRDRVSLLYRLDVALGTLGLLSVTVVVALGFGSLNTGSGAVRHDTFVVLGQPFTYPHLNTAALVLLALATLGIVVLLRAAGAFTRHWRSQQMLLRSLTATVSLDVPSDVTVICEPRPQAFCIGYLRPRVCISAGTVKALGPGEFEAVLAHERHHRAQRDPLRLAVARILSHALFFLPVLRTLTERYSALIELSADDAAVRASGGNRAALASAMLLFADHAPSPVTAVGISADRVDYLLGHFPDARLPLRRVVAALLTLAIVLALAVTSQGSADLDASLNLPLLTASPCIAVLALVPIVLAAASLTCYRGVLRSNYRRPGASGGGVQELRARALDARRRAAGERERAKRDRGRAAS